MYLLQRVIADLGPLQTIVETASLIWNPSGWGSARVTYPGAALATVFAMRPNSWIPFHRDAPAAENGMDGQTLERCHLVVTTNPQCWNFHDGTWQQLREGGVYQMDPTKEHASINLGTTTRVHLVIDVPPSRRCGVE